MAALVEMAGERFGRLVVLARNGSIGKHVAWSCRCDCGNMVVVSGRDMRVGATKSCGCFQKEATSIRATTHGHTKGKLPSPEYYSWGAMHSRYKDHINYSERGITVCDRWKVFENFLADMGPRPVGNYSIERIDNDGNYEPGNCKWATDTEQLRNTRQNLLVEFNGRIMPLSEAAENSSLRYPTIWQRVRSGWPIHLALNAPLYSRFP